MTAPRAHFPPNDLATQGARVNLQAGEKQQRIGEDARGH